MGWDVLAYQTEEKMWEEVGTTLDFIFNFFVGNQVDSAKELLDGFTPSLHYYGGAYSAGGHPDWPEFC